MGDIERIAGRQPMHRGRRFIVGSPRQHIVAGAMMGFAPFKRQEGWFGRIGREILVARDLEQDVIFGVEVERRQRPRRRDVDKRLHRPPPPGPLPYLPLQLALHALLHVRSELPSSLLLSLFLISYPVFFFFFIIFFSSFSFFFFSFF